MHDHEYTIRHKNKYLLKKVKKQDVGRSCKLTHHHLHGQYERGRVKGLCSGKCCYLPVILSLLEAVYGVN